jgi:hypothetical protein
MGGWLSSLSSLSSVPSAGSVVITATTEGVRGFPVGKPLSFFAGPGETVGTVVDRLNVYRGPDQQITSLRYGAGDRMGDPLPFSETVHGEIQAIL